MGWALNENCSKSQNLPSKFLIIEASQSNTTGVNEASNFIQYLKGKNLKMNISSSVNENLKDLISIKYYANNMQYTIYEGNNLNQDIFDSLYKKIISL